MISFTHNFIAGDGVFGLFFSVSYVKTTLLILTNLSIIYHFAVLNYFYFFNLRKCVEILKTKGQRRSRSQPLITRIITN